MDNFVLELGEKGCVAARPDSIMADHSIVGVSARERQLSAVDPTHGNVLVKTWAYATTSKYFSSKVKEYLTVMLTESVSSSRSQNSERDGGRGALQRVLDERYVTKNIHALDRSGVPTYPVG